MNKTATPDNEELRLCFDEETAVVIHLLAKSSTGKPYIVALQRVIDCLIREEDLNMNETPLIIQTFTNLKYLLLELQGEIMEFKL